jgi:hypothetical protein
MEIETPILIPSFSSKGFSFNTKGMSEAAEAIDLSKEFLTDSSLLSAYDLYHNHIPFSEDYICTDVTFLDSGGYETSDIYDFSATAKYAYPIKEWTLEYYKTILDQWPVYKAAVMVSYDHGDKRYDLKSQITAAQDLFSRYPHFLVNFLIKPETRDQKYIQIENILRNVAKLNTFAVIGVTEKELGNSILNRMVNIHKIRNALNANKNPAPIHVFGSLDPVTSILYFLAGAEIFDGLTWLKYSYFEGMAVYQSNYGGLDNEVGIHVRDAQVRSKSIVNNIYCLGKMKYIMKEFSMSNDFSLFDKLKHGLGSYLEKNYRTFESNI